MFTSVVDLFCGKTERKKYTIKCINKKEMSVLVAMILVYTHMSSKYIYASYQKIINKYFGSLNLIYMIRSHTSGKNVLKYIHCFL